MPKPEPSFEKKISIVMRLVAHWKKTPEKTFSEMNPSNLNPPPEIKDLNLQQFLSQVFADRRPDKTPELAHLSEGEWTGEVLKICT
jgi:hypothetical protein